MTVEVLLSCMYEKDMTIISRSNLNNVPVLVVNQCDVINDILTDDGNKHRMLSTFTRGLSASRNMTINNSIADICIISDDDEIFVKDVDRIVEQAYDNNPYADIIIFNLDNRIQKLGNKKKWLKKYDLLRVASWQITFKRDSVQKKVLFDVKLGAGTGNGGGEENKFLFDCYDEGLRILYVPINIASGIEDSGSTWFFGYTEDYFYKLGMSLRYILGFSISFLYSAYTILTKRKLYNGNISMMKAFKNIMQGVFENKLKCK